MSEIILIVFVVFLGAVAIKIGFTFDLNVWRERRDEKLRLRAMNECPHAIIENHPKGLLVTSTIISPPGTIEYHCTRCYLRTYDETMPERVMERYRRNPEAWVRDDKRFSKTARKLM